MGPTANKRTFSHYSATQRASTPHQTSAKPRTTASRLTRRSPSLLTNSAAALLKRQQPAHPISTSRCSSPISEHHEMDKDEPNNDRASPADTLDVTSAQAYQ